ncbi:4Fe-4S dicluster domain-containing protein [Thalassotalea litorea]|uniref:dihydrouracil dehydrogenase (NAD(+)) n=1 Tax=Thalassotalea litorea TaxID=2020715 RepID=A0A5R9ISR2_9GAMM|nr:FAD-dependent oxidoreductase [Thalassotalea litorea]TLU66351.1 4Fe-4S dicluster domain-containing protein [Thalassotalea litorea]
MKKTDVNHYQHYLNVVDCQQACPAHTPVPEYIRLITQKRFGDAYMLNWQSNVFPGILGRVCDRPCEPACRRTRVEDKAVAICRLKRVTADYKEDIRERLPKAPKQTNGKRIALIGAGPASLTVARDLLPLGYQIDLFERDSKAGGMMRSQIPQFRLPHQVLDEELDYILDMGVNTHFDHPIKSLESLLSQDYHAIFIGTGAPKGRHLHLPGFDDCKDDINIGIDWLSGVSFGHITQAPKRVVVLGGGNTAMDCCRTAKRLGATDVKVLVRSSFEAMKASPWEKEDAIAEAIEILADHSPLKYQRSEDGHMRVSFEKVISSYDKSNNRTLTKTGETLDIDCDLVLVAIGQDTSFPWIERHIGLKFNDWSQPVLNKATLQSTLPQVFFGGDSAFGPENIITAVAHGHKAAISIDLYCQGKDPENRPDSDFNLISQKMGMHEWRYDNQIEHHQRRNVPHIDWQQASQELATEVELGFDEKLALKEAQRCLNCDIQTVFSESKCIECSACEDICPLDCINFIDDIPQSGDPETLLKGKLRVEKAHSEQDYFISDKLNTGHIMVKDEDVCVHCGLCAERCPTGAWDMQKLILSNIEATIK